MKKVTDGTRLGLRIGSDLLRAVIYLAGARIRIQFCALEELLEGNSEAVPARLSQHERDKISRVQFAIPRIASRVPFRSDCMIQAIAGQQWLKNHGIRSLICMGAKRDKAGFGAHAWLVVSDVIVTGGDVATYSEFASLRCRKADVREERLWN